MKRPNITTVKEKSDEFVIRIQNKYSQLVHEVNEELKLQLNKCSLRISTRNRWD